MEAAKNETEKSSQVAHQSVEDDRDKRIEELESKTQDLEQQLKEKDQKYLYLYADLQNFRKRAEQDRQQAYQQAKTNLAFDLLDSVDNLERALLHTKETTDPQLSEGLLLTLKQLVGALEKHGVQRIEATGEQFDPNLHEAVSTEASDQAKGTILREELPGYTINGRLLRPARVTVSSGQQKENVA